MEKFSPGFGMKLRIWLTSFMTFALIAGLIALIISSSGMRGSSNIIFWLLISIIFIAIQWWLGPVIIKFATGAREIKEEEFPEIYQMVRNLTTKAGLPMPKLYIVEDPTPNAFAFGRTTKDSAIALHRGLLNVLEKEEIEGVIAHELGHINNKDVAVMTLASVLPVLLYYGVLIFSPRRRDEEIGIGTFLGAIIAQFIGRLLVLWLSRQREYFADEFAARITRKPEKLMMALAKISYGRFMKGEQKAVEALYFAEESKAKFDLQEIAKIISQGNERALINAVENEKQYAMFEFFMTHPLTSKRLMNLLKIKKEIAA